MNHRCRPCHHLRRVHTTRGRRTVTVNRGVPKHRRRQRRDGVMRRKYSHEDLQRLTNKPIGALSGDEYDALQAAGYFESGMLNYGAIFAPEDVKAAARDVSDALWEVRRDAERRTLTDREAREKDQLERANAFLRQEMRTDTPTRTAFWDRPAPPPVTLPKTKSRLQLERDAQEKNPLGFALARLRSQPSSRALNALEDVLGQRQVTIDKLRTELTRRTAPKTPTPDEVTLRVTVPRPSQREARMTDPDANFLVLNHAVGAIDRPFEDPLRLRLQANRLLRQVKLGPLHEADRQVLQDRLHRLKAAAHEARL